jgi:hypothetical protein
MTSINLTDPNTERRAKMNGLRANLALRILGLTEPAAVAPAAAVILAAAAAAG